MEQIIEEYFAYLAIERGSSPLTIDAYAKDLATYRTFLEERGKTDLAHIERDDILAFQKSQLDQGFAVSTLERRLSAIKGLHRFALREGYVDADPAQAIPLPKKPGRLPDVLSIDQVNALLDNVDTSTATGKRDATILEVLYGCGLRVSELVNMEFSQIMADEEFLRVRGKGDKERMVPMSPISLERISEYVDGPRAALTPTAADANIVFLNRRGKRLTRQMIFTIVRRLAEAADIRRTISPHTLRHSFATHLLEGGANLRAIQQMMGHESISTTEIYLNIDTSHLREEILLHHPRNRR